jgi:hypothetical protein
MFGRLFWTFTDSSILLLKVVVNLSLGFKGSSIVYPNISKVKG